MKEVPKISPNILDLFEKNKKNLRSDQITRFNEILVSKLSVVDFLDDISILMGLDAIIPPLVETKDLSQHIESYSKIGLKLENIKGKCWFHENAFAINIGEFQFIKDFEKEQTEDPSHLYSELTSFVSKRIEYLTIIQDFFNAKEDESIWYTVSDVNSLFIGNRTGNIAIVHFKDEKKFKPNIQIQFEGNNDLWKEFKNSKFSVSKSKKY